MRQRGRFASITSYALQQPRAFTTIEILAVLVLMAVSSAVAVFSLGASLRRADLDSAIDAVAAEDHAARDLARRQIAPLRLRFDGMGHSIDLLPSAGPARTWELPADYRIERMILCHGASSSEEAQVTVSSRGWSQPYALLVSGRGQSGWIVFGGFTGRAHQAKDEHDVQEQLGRDEPSAVPAGIDSR